MVPTMPEGSALPRRLGRGGIGGTLDPRFQHDGRESVQLMEIG